MTNRLYYDDPYLTRFTARVVRAEAEPNGESRIYLDESAFYPTSGGQPFDTGTLGGREIADVYVDEDGDVVHRIRGSLTAGETVEGIIDWQRRFDHMQQHAGEHMLAGCLYRRLGGHTIGLHLGREDSTIDADLPDGRTRLTQEEIDALEDEVNARIQADEPIRCWFPTPEELAELPLRKPPTVSEHVRVVRIGDEEYCACGGTHPFTTGQIGLFKILDVRPSRGKIRFTFVCGGRANRAFRRCFNAVGETGRILSADGDRLAAAAAEVCDRLKETQYLLNRAKADMALLRLQAAAACAPVWGGVRVVKCALSDTQGQALSDAAAQLIREGKTVALLSGESGGVNQLVFASSEDTGCDMGKLLSRAAAARGGKGGGKLDFARGSCADAAVLDTAYEMLKEELA